MIQHVKVVLLENARNGYLYCLGTIWNIGQEVQRNGIDRQVCGSLRKDASTISGCSTNQRRNRCDQTSIVVDRGNRSVVRTDCNSVAHQKHRIADVERCGGDSTEKSIHLGHLGRYPIIDIAARRETTHE